MKKTVFLLGIWYIAAMCPMYAQNHHFTHIANLPYSDQLSNIWGYVHTDGTEYALVGTENGVSIVSLANPAQPVETAFVQGSNSIWRALRVRGTRAYVVSDNTTDGLLVIDLSQLPTVSHAFLNPTLNVHGNSGVLESVHTIHIDENGYGYLMGSNLNSGGTLIFDVANSPTNPTYLGATPPIYAHDAYVRNNQLYTSDIYAGNFTIYDITDKSNPITLATQATPFLFTHNTWLSDDSQTIFTTDEKPNAYVAAYDISNLSNITELDRFRPVETEGTGVVPHNVHVLNDYAYVSHYTDGLVVLDGSRPSNLVEIAKYDTYTLDAQTGFRGAWGVYPYLPSGLAIVSDMQTGLHVLQPNFQRACWLEGIVTEMGTGNLLSGVQIALTATAIATQSELDGEYKTGIAHAGTYDVTFFKAGYTPKTVSTSLSNGALTTLNVELEPAVPFSFSGQVLTQGSGVPIPNAKVSIQGNYYNYSTSADGSGNFIINNVYADTYNALAGAWGYHTTQQSGQNIQASSSPAVYVIEEGYRDEFVLDLGWTTVNTCSSGEWERVVPSDQVVHNGSGLDVIPIYDHANDIGNSCYLTGNNDQGIFGADDVDNGITTLISPVMDLSAYNDPHLYFDYWWVNDGGNGSPNDTLMLEIDNGTTTAPIAAYRTSTFGWVSQAFRLSDFITPSSQVTVRFRTSDNNATGGHVVEAAIDHFSVTENNLMGTSSIESAELPECQFAPNPFNHQIRLTYNIPETLWQQPIYRQLSVYNALGQCIDQQPLNTPNTTLSLGQHWESGVYWVEIAGRSYSIVKQ